MTSIITLILFTLTADGTPQQARHVEPSLEACLASASAFLKAHKPDLEYKLVAAGCSVEASRDS